jgi:hypothetical protein
MSGIVFALKINSKKNSSYPFGPSLWAQPEPLRPNQPAGAHLGPAPGAARQRRRRRQALPWRASRDRRGLVCLFKAPPPPPWTLVVPRTSPCTTAAACKLPQWPRRSSRTPSLDSPPWVRTERNRRHQEHPLVETNPFCRSPSPETYRTAATTWRSSQPPGRPPPAGFRSCPCVSAAGEHPHELPLISTTSCTNQSSP